MNAKFFLAVLAASAVAFFSGWLIFGVAFPEFYGSHINTSAMEIIKKPPVMWAIAISNIAWSLLITWLLQKTGNITFAKGFATSLWVSFLIILAFDLSMYSFFDIYEIKFVALDIIVSSLFWGIVGGVAGLVLGTGNK